MAVGGPRDAAELTAARPRRGPQRILVGTDGGPRAGEAVRQAAQLAALGGELEVIHVIDVGRPHPGPPEEDLGARGDRILAHALEVAGSERVQAEARLLAGDPAEVLSREARERGAGLLCVGPDASLLGLPARVGRVAARVLRDAPCSVLVARRPAWAGRGPFPRRILVGVDGSPDALEAVGQAATLARLARAELRLAHVTPALDVAVRWTEGSGAEAAEVLRPAVALAEELGTRPIQRTALGRPGPALVEGVRRDGADLLVVGCRGLRGLSRVMLGSVSEWVAVHATCSVLVARAAG